MNYALEFNRLSPFELELVKRAALAQNTMEYLRLLHMQQMIRVENQSTSMYLASAIKSNPELLNTANIVLELKKQNEYIAYKQERQQENVAEKEIKAEKISSQEEKARQVGLLTALRCAIDIAVYKAKAASIALGNDYLRRTVKHLQKVQKMMEEAQKLDAEYTSLKQQKTELKQERQEEKKMVPDNAEKTFFREEFSDQVKQKYKEAFEKHTEKQKSKNELNSVVASKNEAAKQESSETLEEASIESSKAMEPEEKAEEVKPNGIHM
ncbi:MAG: hypothetical protein V8T87_17665 [Victivallales bacterium]